MLLTDWQNKDSSHYPYRKFGKFWFLAIFSHQGEVTEIHSLARIYTTNHKGLLWRIRKKEACSRWRTPPHSPDPNISEPTCDIWRCMNNQAISQWQVSMTVIACSKLKTWNLKCGRLSTKCELRISVVNLYLNMYLILNSWRFKSKVYDLRFCLCC